MAFLVQLCYNFFIMKHGIDSDKLSKTYPRRLDGFKMYNLGDEIVLYSSTQEMTFALNNSAKAIWELCDGQRSVDEICQELDRHFDCAKSQLRSDVVATINKLEHHKILELIPESQSESV